MDKVFLDTDVCIDFISARQPYYSEARSIILRSKNRYDLYLSEGSIPNLIYIQLNTYKTNNGIEILSDFIRILKVISSDQSTILRSLKSDFIDKEDAYQYFTAMQNGVDYFITRNIKDYQPFTSNLPVLSPKEFLAHYT